MVAVQPGRAAFPASPVLGGRGLTLQPWDDDLARRMANWGERGFPYHAFDLGYLREPARLRRLLQWVKTDSRHRHFVACDGGEPVGRISVNLEDPAGLYLWAIHVPPEHEGRGVCRTMVSLVVEWLRSIAPARAIVLTTNTFALAAHRAYAAAGFRSIETRWQYDAELSRELWRLPRHKANPIAEHVRFRNGRWEVRTYLMRYEQGDAAINRSRAAGRSPATPGH